MRSLKCAMHVYFMGIMKFADLQSADTADWYCNVMSQRQRLNSRFCSSDDRRAADSNCKIIIENQKGQLLHKT